jgi:putative transposase
MPPVLRALLAVVIALFCSRRAMPLDMLARRHQVAVYKQSVQRPRLRPADRLFWVWLARLWPHWQAALAFVHPRTMIAWPQRRFRDHWRRLSQRGTPGRPAIAKDVRDLIRTMWRANPTWGTPRIMGELRTLGIEVATSTVEKYRVRSRKSPSPTWKSFLKNHMQDLVSLDFCVVPTVTFTVLFVLVILTHERHRIVHCNVTAYPTAAWPAQQVVEAFPWDDAPRYVLRDRDRIDGAAFRQRVRRLGIADVLIAPRPPWQHPSVERVLGRSRRDRLEHVIVLHAQHRRRLLTEDLTYSHRFRTHLSLAMDCPVPRPVAPPEADKVSAGPEVGGLHHHYERWAA